MSGQRAAPEPYDVEITAEGRRNLARLPEKTADVVHAFVFEALAAMPKGVGKPLVGEFKGLWSACREQYRVVYEIDDLRHVAEATDCPQTTISAPNGGLPWRL